MEKIDNLFVQKVEDFIFFLAIVFALIGYILSLEWTMYVIIGLLFLDVLIAHKHVKQANIVMMEMFNEFMERKTY